MIRLSTLLVSCLVVLAACGKDKSASPDAGASVVCKTFGDTCAMGSECCDAICANGKCGSDPSTCSMAGTSCTANTDCCTTSCIGNVCGSAQCVADNGACAGDGECCGGKCANSTCTPLNPSCKTEGNPCGAGTECCSQFCNPAGTCGQPSFCVQNGDACATDGECCGGICNPGPGGLGTCTSPMPGSTNCSAGVDGTVCDGCNSCCSRLCAPFAATGVSVCQPAEGCRIDGDLCQKDLDCCGGDPNNGLPGAGNVHCLREHPSDLTGICRNPMGCDPEGDVCHYKDYTTCGNSSARNDCCAGPGNSGVCQLDALGVPRCYGLGACRNPGDTCASSADCCDGTPCTPDSGGILHCGTGCQMTGTTCTASADCCNGLTCTYAPGSTQGTCGGMPTTCAQYGQMCNDTNPCCDGAGCNVTGSDPVTACAPGGTNCTCFNIIF